MGNLSESQLGGVRRMIQAASDRAIRDLEAALSSGVERHEAMRLIQRMVVAEAQDRRACALTFAPIAPMCRPRRDRPRGVVYPFSVLSLLWRGLRETRAAEVQRVVLAASNPDADPPTSEQLDSLCAAGSEGLKARSSSAFATAGDVLDKLSDNACESFTTYLDLAPVARLALERLPEWLGRQTDERVAAARLAFRDAAAVCDDGGPKLLDLLYSHMEEPWLVLRLISILMNRPADTYVANSEFSGFGEGLLRDVDARVRELAEYELDGGPERGAEIGRSLRVATQAMAEFETALDLAPTGPWGGRIMRQKRELAAAVEVRLKMLDEVLGAALPVHSSSSGRRTPGLRGPPVLTKDPDPAMVERAKAFFAFMREVRMSGERLGFMSLWNRVAEEARVRIDGYVDDLLEELRATEEGDDPERVRRYLDVAASLLALLADDRAAQIVRRRMAAAA
jgi:hypothetical protein